MLSVIYVSAAAPDLETNDIAALFEQAEANNRRDALTGALIYNDQNFMQLLEGPVAKVEACLARIRADLRHSGMIEIRRRLIDAREFAAFSMLYRPLFKGGAPDFSQLAVGDAIDPMDERVITNFLALGRRGGAG